MLYRLRHNKVDINKDLTWQFKYVSKEQIEMFKTELKSKRLRGNSRACIRWFSEKFGISITKSTFKRIIQYINFS